MTIEELSKQYQERHANFQNLAEEGLKRYNRFSFVRLVVFIAALAILILLWTNNALVGGIATLLFLIAFEHIPGSAACDAWLMHP